MGAVPYKQSSWFRVTQMTLPLIGLLTRSGFRCSEGVHKADLDRADPRPYWRPVQLLRGCGASRDVIVCRHHRAFAHSSAVRRGPLDAFLHGHDKPLEPRCHLTVRVSAISTSMSHSTSKLRSEIERCTTELSERLQIVGDAAVITEYKAHQQSLENNRSFAKIASSSGRIKRRYSVNTLRTHSGTANISYVS